MNHDDDTISISSSKNNEQPPEATDQSAKAAPEAEVSELQKHQGDNYPNLAKEGQQNRYQVAQMIMTGSETQVVPLVMDEEASASADRSASQVVGLTSQRLDDELGDQTEVKAAEGEEIEDEDEAKCQVGQLVLNVDFAPPRPPAAPHTRQISGRSLEGSGISMNSDGHLIELSLCIKQRHHPEAPEAAAPVTPDIRSTCDKQHVEERQQKQQDASSSSSTQKQQVKRRLVYERIDKFTLEIGRQVKEPPTVASFAATGSLTDGDQQEAARSTAPTVRLPFKSATFDACFCFNLLNLRVQPHSVGGSPLTSSPEAEVAEWRRLDALTSDLRLALLNELSRVVKSSGKIMVTVLACECHEQDQPEQQEQQQQQQQQRHQRPPRQRAARRRPRRQRQRSELYASKCKQDDHQELEEVSSGRQEEQRQRQRRGRQRRPEEQRTTHPTSDPDYVAAAAAAAVSNQEQHISTCGLSEHTGAEEYDREVDDLEDDDNYHEEDDNDEADEDDDDDDDDDDDNKREEYLEEEIEDVVQGCCPQCRLDEQQRRWQRRRLKASGSVNLATGRSRRRRSSQRESQPPVEGQKKVGGESKRSTRSRKIQMSDHQLDEDTCDTIQQLIDLNRTATDTDTTTTETTSGPNTTNTTSNLSSMSRRYSTAIWRAVGGGAGSESCEEPALPVSASNSAAATLNADSISEAAKRIGRRLSLGGASLLGRLLAATEREQPATQQQQQQQCFEQVDQVSGSGESPPGGRCDIEVQQANNEDEDDSALMLLNGSTLLGTSNQQVHPGNVINFFQDDEFAKRHRQSIAVHSFFTKSVEVHADEEEEEEEEEENGQLAHSRAAEPDSTAPEKAPEAPETNLASVYHDDDAERKHDKYLARCGEAESAPSAAATATATTSAVLEEEYEDLDLAFTNDDSTSSGWTAPTTTSTAGAGGVGACVGESSSGANVAELLQHETARSRSQLSDCSKSGTDRREGVASGRAESEPAPTATVGGPLGRLNSDPSSFTLITSTTANNRTDSSGSPMNGTAAGTTGAPLAIGRREREVKGANDNDGPAGGLELQLQQQQQRRAFSETEAYAANFRGIQVNNSFDTNQLITDGGLAKRARQLPLNLINCDPAAIGSLASGTPMRQIRSAEATRYSSQVMASGRNSARSQHHHHQHQHHQQQHHHHHQQSRASQLPSTCSGSSSNSNQHSATNLIAGGGSSGSRITGAISHIGAPGGAYTPLLTSEQSHQQQLQLQLLAEQLSTTTGQQAPIHSYASGTSAAAKELRQQHQAALVRYQAQKQQWCHSNTFSSSLNSDISTTTSGPKDTTEKDSSRRTSTLSGISSIYQQEISLAGLTTPHSYTTAGGSSTPANSQAAACSNMGSIPELATLEPVVGGVSAAAAALPPSLMQQVASTTGAESNDISGAAVNRFRRTSAASDAHQQRSSVGDLFAHLEELDGGQVACNANGETHRPVGSFDHHQIPPGSSPSMNLQRVAQSLRSQLRERLPTTMRTFNALMGIANSDVSATSGVSRIQEEQVLEEEPQLQQQQQQPADMNTGGQLRVGGLADSTTCSPFQRQNSTGLSSPTAPNSSASQQSSYRTGVPGGFTGSATNRTETPTPAILKSFFRSTSSAAFNAFASSFQHQSSSSTPTATTAVHLQNLSTSSQQLASGSLSSDVFDPSTTCGGGGPGGLHSTGLLSPIQTSLSNDQTFTGDSPATPTAPARSPLSPISVTSSRFFARIRDKFSLSPTSAPSGTASPRPSSSAALSTSTSTCSTNNATTSVISGSGRLLLRQQSRPTLEQPSTGSPQAPLEGSSKSEETSGQKDSAEKDTPTSGPAAVPAPPTETFSSSNNNTSSGSDNLRKASIATSLTTTSDNQLTSTSTEPPAESTTTTNSTSSPHSHAQQQQQPARALRASAIAARANLAKHLADSYDDYDTVVALRRPSFQRQLDEQVNQVYRMAVDRKLQLSGIGESVMDAAAASATCLDKHGKIINQTAVSSGSNAAAAAARRGSDLDSIIRPMSALLANGTITSNIALPLPVVGATVTSNQSGSNQMNGCNSMQSIYLPSYLYSSDQSASQSSSYYNQYCQPMAATTGGRAPFSATSQARLLLQANQQAAGGVSMVGLGACDPTMALTQGPRAAAWIDSSQQSIDSSSSARSLRSCWFSMPELYAMNYDSSSQSPSSGLNPNHLFARTTPTMDELAGALTSGDGGGGLASLAVSVPVPGASAAPMVEQVAVAGSHQQPVGDWPSGQLYRQVTHDGQNWSLSDLNLTSDDIAPVRLAASQQPQVNRGVPVGREQQKFERDQQQVELMKGATLDDSVCISMQSNSSRENLPANTTSGAGSPLRLARSAASALNNMNATTVTTTTPTTTTIAGSKQELADNNQALFESRPTSQNSTISSTSCALSDLNSSELQDMRVSPISQQQSVATTTTGGDESPSPGLPDMGGLMQTTTTTGSSLSNGQLALAAPRSPPLIPQCMVTSHAQVVESNQHQEAVVSGESRSSSCDEAAAAVAAANQHLKANRAKQRAMSLGLVGVAADQSAGGVNVFETAAAGGLSGRSSAALLDTETTGCGGAGSPANTCVPMRGSRRPTLQAGQDVAPASATLDLRLPAMRKNRVRLTDLHPITFINDREFLNSMSSLRKADDNKLNAIFNGPVGRRLSVNAELAQQSPFNQAKSGIKIGLTGYVYVDPKRTAMNAQQRLQQQHFRRPSLAPNFWLQQARRAEADAAAANASATTGTADFCGDGNLLGVAPRPRAASCTPTALDYALNSGPMGELAVGPTSTPTLTTTDAPSITTPEPPKTTTAATLGTFLPSTSGAPHSLAPDSRRRSSVAMLSRLSEASIETNELEGAVTSGGADTPVAASPATNRWEQQSSARNQPAPIETRTNRMSVSCMLKIGEDEELKSGSAAAKRASNRQTSCSDSSPDSEEVRAEQEPETGETEPLRRSLQVKNSSNSNKRNSSSSSNGSSSSSDDGDIDKLAAQYPDVGYVVPRRRTQSFCPTGNHLRRSQTTESSVQPTGLGVQNEVDDRVVKNEAILKQLLMAANAASLAKSASSAETTGEHQDGVGTGVAGNERRRFSAINLYQRDEDVFVANSMRRPPGSQMQMLSTLPLLAGTLPVLTSHHQNSQPAKSAGSLHHNQLPLLTNQRVGVKSIITGNSGLCLTSGGDTFNNNSNSQQQQPKQPQQMTARQISIGEVDIEEQLNRLRQQEKRSMAFAAFGESSSSSPEAPVDQLESLCDVRNVTVPNSPIAIPAILQPPESLSLARNPKQQQAPIPIPLPAASDTLISQLASKSPPQSSSSSSNSPPNLTSLLSGRVDASPLIHSVVSKGSCVEPAFKQLDTIIEGRGLLLGAEQQADPSYTNRLRRLSGNSRRMSPSGSIAAGTGASDSSLTLTTNYQSSEGDWCRCDLNSPRRLSLSRKLSASQQDSAASTARNSRQVSEIWNTGEPSPATTTATSTGSSISSSSRFVLDTMKSLARRTLNNLATISASGSIDQPNKSPLDAAAAAQSRQTRSSSMVVGSSSSGSSFSWQQAGNTAGGTSGQPTLPSRFLREKVREQQSNQRRNQQDLEEGVDLEDEEESSSASSVTISADDSSLMSLDDAENYLAKNKDNQMKHGQTLESASSSSSSSSETSSLCNLNLNLNDEDINDYDADLKRRPTIRNTTDNSQRNNQQLKVPVSGRSKQVAGSIKLASGGQKRENEHQSDDQEEEAEDEEETEFQHEDDEEEEEEEAPKVCYKCNKLIRVEPQVTSRRQDFFGENLNLRRSQELNDESGEQLLQQQVAAKPRRSSQSARAHHGRRRTAARRSASMNSAELEPQAANSAPQHIAGRRKNKWHIQRNLAPKLKRQRSFSANYAPEVPNPVMPPPRRFSAAPTLSCPHRNKSSSHSSSSLHRTYSIDSSESMITVIPANPGQEPIKRTSRGSLSCNSGVSTTGTLGGLDTSPSYYNLPKSPLSPRSPSRCSPSILTPNSSEPPNSLLDQSIFSTSTTTNCSSVAAPTVICQLPVTSTSQHKADSSSTRSQSEARDPFNLGSIRSSLSRASLTAVASGDDDNLSLTVENGTSHNSSRYDLNIGAGDEVSFASELPDHVEQDEAADKDQDNYLQPRASGSGESIPAENKATSIVSETVNDFCARHSREELEFLVGQVGYLKISDCYFSKKSSTLCMVIDVDEK